MTGSAGDSGRVPDSPRSRDAGALYVHLQSETGVEHRTVILTPKKVKLLRVLWSGWGVMVLLAFLGSWTYLGIQTARVPMLKKRIRELETEALRIDTLQAKLLELQQQYDHVFRMLGVPPDTGTSGTTPLNRR